MTDDTVGRITFAPNQEPLIQSRYCPPRCQGTNHELFRRMVEVLKAIEPYLLTESQMLDDASLNEGRASGFGVVSMKARAILKEIDHD